MNALQEDAVVKWLKQGGGFAALCMAMIMVDPMYLICVMVWWGVFIKME
jgi:hypothetical protein